jgi:protein PsiE
MGHTSLNFLMSLGITALLRNLITAHGEPMQILIHAVAILLLIIGIVILNKHIKL